MVTEGPLQCADVGHASYSELLAVGRQPQVLVMATLFEMGVSLLLTCSWGVSSLCFCPCRRNMRMADLCCQCLALGRL